MLQAYHKITSNRFIWFGVASFATKLKALNFTLCFSGLAGLDSRFLLVSTVDVASVLSVTDCI